MRGRTLPYIANELFVTTGTVKTHVRHIYEKALEEFGISAESSVFIDDKAMNIAGANEAGIRGIRFSDARKLRELLIEQGIDIPAVQ